ncbi:MAG: hypothetical protein AB1810_08315 [Pseudomonadota bacterium]
MKRFAQAVTIVFALGQPYAQADERHHPEAGKQAETPTAASSKGMGMMDMNAMQDMHKTMERIRQSNDPAERQRLMQEHMEQMHKMMNDMHGMMGMGGMSGGEAQQTMEKRMDMMQGMMEQMMEHMMAQQGMQAPGGGKDKGQDKADPHKHTPAK